MHQVVKAVHELRCRRVGLQKKFAELDDSAPKEVPGEFNANELSQKVRKYGDGYTIHSLPRSADALKAADVLVLFAVTSPKLDKNSDFNPLTPLHKIPFWRCGKRLVSKVCSGRQKLQLHFMSWQQNITVHGKNDSHAKKNYRLLSNRIPQFKELLGKEKKMPEEFICQCRNWLNGSGKEFIVITNFRKRPFDEPIEKLARANGLTHIQASLRGRNYQIMARIRDFLFKGKSENS